MEALKKLVPYVLVAASVLGFFSWWRDMATLRVLYAASNVQRSQLDVIGKIPIHRDDVDVVSQKQMRTSLELQIMLLNHIERSANKTCYCSILMLACGIVLLIGDRKKQSTELSLGGFK